MRKQKKSEKLPEFGTPERTVLVSITPWTADYIQNIEKGLPLFAHEELERLEKQYRGANDNEDQGMTWEEIENELSKKGIKLRKATFRKYIQEKYLPAAMKYKKSGTRRVAIFPSDIISHINFIQYFYRFADREAIEGILNRLEGPLNQMDYLQAIESVLSKSGYSRGFYGEILDYIGLDMDSGLTESIKKVLFNRPNDKEKVFAMLEEIDDLFKNTVENRIMQLLEFLETNMISLSEIPKDTDKQSEMT